MVNRMLRWRCAVGFLGGWEPRRERLLHAVAAAGVDLKLWGGYWDFLHDGQWTPRRHMILRQLAGGEPFAFHIKHAWITSNKSPGYDKPNRGSRAPVLANDTQAD